MAQESSGLIGVRGQPDQERGPRAAGEISIEIRGVRQVPEDARYGNVGRLFTMWVKMNPAMFFVGALAGAPIVGLGLVPAIIAILIANALGASITAVFATFGPRTGVPQLQHTRLSFGGATPLPSALQWVTQIGFEALTLLFVAEALSVLFGTAFYVSAVIGLVCMGIISMLGYEVIHSFQKIVTGLFAVLFAILTVSILREHPHAVQTTHGAAAVGGFLLMVAVALGIILFPHSASDYSRYLPVNTSRTKIMATVFSGLLLSVSWIEILGVLGASLLKGTSTMRGVYNIVGGGALGSTAMVTMAIAAISIMVFTDYSGALAAQAAGVNLLRPIITVASAIVAFAVALWLHAGNVSGRFEDVLLLISYWVTPWAAIVLIHWWRIGRHMDRKTCSRIFSAPLRSLGLLEGRGPAAAAVVALVIGFLAGLPFSDTGLDPIVAHNIPWLGWLFGGISRAYLHGGDLDFYVGFLVAGAIYGAWLAATGRWTPQPRNPEADERAALPQTPIAQ